MLGKFFVAVVVMVAVGLNASYTEITDKEVIVEEATMVEAKELEFTDVDGNVLMTGSAEYITKAEMTYGIASSYPNYEYYVTLYFTNEGKEKFKSITESVVEREAMGENYINIVVGGEVVSIPMVTTAIYADSCIISGGFTKETAQELADMINAGIQN